MREIIFRAWDKISNKMLDDVGSTYDWEIMPTMKGSDSHYALMQYTGLKDCKGKEIYEGDIVKTPASISVVEFDMGLFGLNHDYGTDNKTMLGSWGSKCNLRRLYDGYNDVIEVIGNIYQNPELLNKTKNGGGSSPHI